MIRIHVIIWFALFFTTVLSMDGDGNDFFKYMRDKPQLNNWRWWAIALFCAETWALITALLVK